MEEQQSPKGCRFRLDRISTPRGKSERAAGTVRRLSFHESGMIIGPVASRFGFDQSGIPRTAGLPSEIAPFRNIGPPLAEARSVHPTHTGRCWTFFDLPVHTSCTRRL